MEELQHSSETTIKVTVLWFRTRLYLENGNSIPVEDTTGVSLCHKNETTGQHNAKRISFIPLKYPHFSTLMRVSHLGIVHDDVEA